MDEQIKELAKKQSIDIPESFNNRFEETLNNIPSKKKIKYSRYQIAASIVATILLGSGVAIAMANNRYKYVPTTGNVLDMEGSVYGLEETIVTEDQNGNEITLDIQIIEDMDRAIVNVGGMYFLPESEKSELKIGDKIYKNDRASIGEWGYSWGAVDVFYNLNKYEEGQDVVYTVYLDNENKVDFNLSLKEIKGVENYDNLGIVSKYNNIEMTSIINEKEDEMVIDFFSSDNPVYITPGIDGVDGTFSSIYLIDANGKRVNGLRKVENGAIKSNRVRFDTRDTQKPYKVIVPQVIAEFFMIENNDIYSDEIILDVPKDGEAIEINKDIKLDIESTGIKTDNETVKLTTGRREGNKFMVNIEYPENERSKDYLRQVFAVEKRVIGKDKLTFAQTDCDENFEFVDTLEFDVNMFKNKIKFKLSPCIYDLKGNWEFIIE
ncbi:MAG: hypothetical protein ACRC3Y_04910 [Romboutsia sp.]|uniref:hypothetical protein n=1 Tax=Romboutsia sp. TaxID=1965302 RepID=UPI003F3DCC0A